MTQEEKFTALAKYLGWEPDPINDLWYSIDGKTAGFRKETGVVEIMPRWFEDLNAVHKIKNTLTEFQSIVYVINLSGGGFPIYESSAFRFLNSTASEQANALGQTFGLWE